MKQGRGLDESEGQAEFLSAKGGDGTRDAAAHNTDVDQVDCRRCTLRSFVCLFAQLAQPTLPPWRSWTSRPGASPQP